MSVLIKIQVILPTEWTDEPSQWRVPC